MSKPLKVLFLLEDLCFGGTQTQNLELALRIDPVRFSPAILTLTGPTDLDERVEKAAIPLFHVGSERRVPPLFFTKLGKFLDQLQPDILVPCTALPNIWGRIWGKLKKVPAIIGTCRGGGALFRQHERLLWRLADGFVCNSRQLLYGLKELGASEERLAYIANGVDIDRFRPETKPFSPENPLIVCVARLAHDKNHQTLIQAFARVLETFPGARLRLVGEGPEEEKLRNFTQTVILEPLLNHVEFAGASASPEKHYAEADICALSSVREAQPNAILEAMSSARPVCATAVGAIPEMLEGAGLISPPEDAELFAENLLALLCEPGLAAQLGSTGRQKAEQEYSFSRMVNKHEDFFLKIYKQRGA